MTKNHLACLIFILFLASQLAVLPATARETGIPAATANHNVLAGLEYSPQTDISSILQQPLDYDPVLGDMISQVDESEIHQSIYDLQNFSTRIYPSQGNREAASYIYQRLVAIPGLEVERPGDRYQNVIASLRGKDNTSEQVFIVGAHYDSISPDPEHAPGAADDGSGVAIVLELARVMSRYQFNHTVQFAFWNGEEHHYKGSTDFVANASKNSLDIPLYMNYDCWCYDPDNNNILSVIYNRDSRSYAYLLTQYNSLYDIDFNLTFNFNQGSTSDHIPFWQGGYPAVTTLSQFPPQHHKPNDTIEHVSVRYAKKNAQLGLVIFATTAEVSRAVPAPDGVGTPRTLNGDGKDGNVNDDSRVGVPDIVLYFNRPPGITANEAVGSFDYNGNGRVYFADVVWLFHHR